ncbi:MAG: thiamine pyrophosphate-binding protein [Treponema sp.]|nr:thiamine pyrophosphate-binding protein [Treponema sp.]
MKQRVADYIADFFASNGITDLFTVTGGGAMHLNDAFGHHPKLRCVYNHHEQASAIAAEGYARYSGNIAALCVTTGPGGVNALNGVLGGWLDSVPMFIVSGQVKFSTTIKSTDVPLRQLGDQEFNIVDCVKTMTKFAQMIVDPNDIAYYCEKALYIATHGRKGPVWLDVPLNVQGAIIETESLRHYDCAEDASILPPAFSEEKAREVLQKIKEAKRPVILAGEGVRFSGAYQDFLRLIEKLNVPVVTAWNAHDLLWDEHPLYCGRPGTVGTRGGNFCVQYSDLLLVLGCRLNIRQISYNWENFASMAYKIMVDIDQGELLKPTLKIDMPLLADAKDAICLMEKIASNDGRHKKWLDWCRAINARFPACLPEYYKKESPVNPYVLMDLLFKGLEEGDAVVTSNGSACVISFQAALLKKNQRLFTNSGCASMGYGLPAALGVALARGKEKKTVCIEGDGSLMMNLQELQTLVYNNFNLKLFVINNNGYHSIRQTQTNLFSPPLVGVCDGNGLSFPDFEKLSAAFGIPYYKIDSVSDASQKISEALKTKGPVFVEPFVDSEQFFSPKLSSRKLPDGSMVSPSLEDMFPFLPQEEMKAIREEGLSI